MLLRFVIRVQNAFRFYSAHSLYKTILHSRSKQFDLLKDSIINNANRPLTIDFVDRIRREITSLGSAINHNNFDSLFVDACILTDNFNMGKAFFLQILSNTDKPRLGVIGKYFKLCYSFIDLCDEGDHQRLLALYSQVRHDYPFLDHVSIEHIIEGLSITTQWKECLNLLEFANVNTETSFRMYVPIIIAAFKNDEHEVAKQLMTRANSAGFKLGHTAFSAWFQYSKTPEKAVEDIFKFCQIEGVFLPIETADIIMAKYKKFRISKMYHGGRCYFCSGKFPPIYLSDEEFFQLREEFLAPVLIGKDIFLKSQPAEFEAFKKFLAKNGNVDVVIDGLNVAYSVGLKKGTFEHSLTLRLVVEHFINQRQRVMVLGRNHMRKWPQKDLAILSDYNCPVFFTDDLSQDDPLILYAAMHSGKCTKFVSRDLMRSHKFLLKTAEAKNAFEKWQQKNQLFVSYVEKNGKVFLKTHIKHLVGAQKSDKGDWHCPLDEPPKPGIPPHVHFIHLPWLCTAPNRKYS